MWKGEEGRKAARDLRFRAAVGIPAPALDSMPEGRSVSDEDEDEEERAARRTAMAAATK